MLSAPLQVPFFFKHAIDALSIDPTGAATANYLGVLQLTPVALMLGYGIARAGAAFCGEMRNVVFAKVSQSVIRGMAKQVKFCSSRPSSMSSPGATCLICAVWCGGDALLVMWHLAMTVCSKAETSTMYDVHVWR
jgi:hypothetical protein